MPSPEISSNVLTRTVRLIASTPASRVLLSAGWPRPSSAKAIALAAMIGAWNSRSVFSAAVKNHEECCDQHRNEAQNAQQVGFVNGWQVAAEAVYVREIAESWFRKAHGA